MIAMDAAAAPAFDVEGPVQAEVFVVYLAGGQPMLTGPCGPDPWYLEVSAADDPMTVVGAAIRRVVGEPMVVHSTSWRRDRDAVILTFVTVVDSDTASGLLSKAVARADLARGGATTAPTAIAAEQVVEHGLRHLAWLANDDPAVARRLSPDWRAALARYTPQPFVRL
jgi:hypothetical protein